jgi:hypothetical protein
MTATSEIEKFFKDIQKSIGSPANMLKLGGFTIKLILIRTRGQGKGVMTPGGQARKLKLVTTKYAEKRRQMKGKHPEAAAGRSSNLTLFGHMLNNMIVKKATTADLVIGFRSHKEEQKAEGQDNQGRRFMILSGAEMQQAKTFLADLVARQNR